MPKSFFKNPSGTGLLRNRSSVPPRQLMGVYRP